MSRPSIIAHRGASGYEYENSKAAFRRALTLDVDGLELDVHATCDGGIVVHHDAEIPGCGPIAQLTLRQVRQARLRNGEVVPLLAEVLELAGDCDVYVEVKSLPPGFDDRLFDALDDAPCPTRYRLHGFDHRIIQRLGEARPEFERGILLSAYLADPVAAMAAVGARTLWQEWHLIDRALIECVHAAGGTVIAWTVNEVADLARLARLGVDGLCGNYPDRIRVAMAMPAEGSSLT